jgi:hypothetical protein
MPVSYAADGIRPGGLFFSIPCHWVGKEKKMAAWENFKSRLSNENPAALTIDGFDEAIVGIGRRCGCPSLAIYDYAKIIQILERNMTPTDALEYYEFNIAGAYMGENTPIIVTIDSSFATPIIGESWDA